MASPFKDKIQVFFFGLMLGLLIGACFFVFKLDSYFKELSFYKSFSKNNFVKEVVVEAADENKSAEKKNSAPGFKTKSRLNPGKSDTSNSVNVAPVKQSVEHRDSVRPDSSVKTFEENIVVKKDEMIASKMLEIQTLPGIKDAASANSDSLLNKISGIKKETPGATYKVEYWMSPLNYRGYKLLKNKIILYGINPAENLKIYKIDGVVYCKNSSLVYKLDYSPEFRYFEIVSDESVIAKIK
jgi:hypothetical protein